MKPLENEKLRKQKIDETLYRGAIGSLLYLAICTRPDIIFAVSKAARKSKEPTMGECQKNIQIPKRHHEFWFKIFRKDIHRSIRRRRLCWRRRK